MLKINKISVKAENKLVLDSVSMEFELGKNYCILGKN